MVDLQTVRVDFLQGACCSTYCSILAEEVVWEPSVCWYVVEPEEGSGCQERTQISVVYAHKHYDVVPKPLHLGGESRCLMRKVRRQCNRGRWRTIN